MSNFSINFSSCMAVIARPTHCVFHSHTTEKISLVFDAAFGFLTVNQSSNDFSLVMVKLGSRGAC